MFVVCGEAVYDLFAGAADGDGAIAIEAVTGGSLFNVARGLARLGQPSAFLGGLSRDQFGRSLAARLAEDGVSLAFARDVDNPTTLSVVATDAAGVPHYTFYGRDAADRALRPEDVPALPSGAAVHVGSYALVARPIADAIAALVTGAAGHFVSLDPNARPRIEPDRQVWLGRIAEILPSVTLVKVSTEDLGFLHPGEDPATVARRWRAAGPGLVVVTDGSKGATAYGAFGVVHRPAKPVAVVDTVGAGDSFMARLLVGLAERGLVRPGGPAEIGATIAAALLDEAIAAAAYACARRGGQLPRRGDL